MQIKLYSTKCPKCIVMEKKLEKAGHEFEVITDFSIDDMKERGFMSAPILQVDDEYMNFEKANKWVSENRK